LLSTSRIHFFPSVKREFGQGGRREKAVTMVLKILFSGGEEVTTTCRHRRGQGQHPKARRYCATSDAMRRRIGALLSALGYETRGGATRTYGTTRFHKDRISHEIGAQIHHWAGRRAYATVDFHHHGFLKSAIPTARSGVSATEQVEVPLSWSQVASDVLGAEVLRKAGVPRAAGKVKKRALPNSFARRAPYRMRWRRWPRRALGGG